MSSSAPTSAPPRDADRPPKVAKVPAATRPRGLVYRSPPQEANVVNETISAVRFVQAAAVSAYIKVNWIDDTEQHKDLGPWKSIDTEEEFVLTDEGVPNGVTVNFSSYVSAVGEYTNDRWWQLDSSHKRGAIFKQTGTAFKGWFEFEGYYDYV